MAQFDKLTWDELREQLRAVAAGPAYHELADTQIPQLVAEALVRIMGQIDTTKTGPSTSKHRKK